MHRVDATGYDSTTVPGKRLFHDKALPTWQGTKDASLWNNAVQEEICSVIEGVGNTLRSTGVDDRNAGWDQLYTAIFHSNHITDDAIDAITFDSLSGGDIDITVGDDSWYQNVTGFAYADAATNSSVNMSAGTLNAKKNGARTLFDGRGVYYNNGPGDWTTVFPSGVYLRKAMFPNIDLTSTTWDVFVAGSGCHEWSGEYITDIPTSCTPLKVWAYIWNGTYFTCYPSGCQFRQDGGYWKITDLVVTNGRDTIAVSAMHLFIEYDAEDLTV